MKEYVKTYLMGLLTIVVVLHPLLVAKLIGMEMSKSGDIFAAYFCSLVIEIVVTFFILLPFFLGKKIQKAIKDTK